MEAKPSGIERVVLVHIDFPAGKMEEDLAELKELALAAGAEIVHVVSGTRRVPEAKYFVSKGKAEEILSAVKSYQADLVIFNHVLSPAQERNLERLINCRVIDRTGLILDIFAQRARSFEGKLQVELATLKHLSTRLIRGWTHLERQRGGIGLRGGPGETQLEVDRRLIRQKIKMITARLARIRKQREQGRRSRRRAIVPTVALVGYTNAGKSTLFNRLTGASVYVADQLFATLDPTLRRINLSEAGHIILADTVGFIRHLPHDLVQAFHATLEEVSEADLLLHVVDVMDENKKIQIDQVEQVLSSINALDVPRLVVYNKIDLNPALEPKIERDAAGSIKRVLVSATENLGMAPLLTAIKEKLGQDLIQQAICLKPSQAKIRAQLYQQEAVLQESIDELGNFHLIVRLPRLTMEEILAQIKATA